jgi:hypothetical protein
MSPFASSGHAAAGPIAVISPLLFALEVGVISSPGCQREASMNASQWAIVMLVTLAAAAATPSWGQDVVPTAVPANTRGIQGAASIPDLSGIWGRNWFIPEPPSSGLGPVLSRLRRPDGTLIGNPRVGDYTNPILRPQAAEVVKRNGELELGGTSFPNPHSQCWPKPTPGLLFVEYGVQIIQWKDEIVLLCLSDHQVRRVHVNVPHSEHPTPTWQGESVGHYEGDSLVIDLRCIRVDIASAVFIRQRVRRATTKIITFLLSLLVACQRPTDKPIALDHMQSRAEGRPV